MMKIHHSPLSIVGALSLVGGTYLTIVMIMGAWPTYFAFVFLAVGVIILVLDYFIRKSGMNFRTKLFIQSLCSAATLLMVYLFFSGYP
jgi:hypothetical protein